MKNIDNPISIIDVSSLQNKAPSPELLRSFHEAYHNQGFGYIINHGVDHKLIEKVFEYSRCFHNLSLNEKMKVSLDHNHRGYIAINTSTDVNSKFEEIKKPNQSASFMMMREDQAENNKIYLSGPNQWPELDGFRSIMEQYNAELSTLANKLIRVALFLGEKEAIQKLCQQLFHSLTSVHNIKLDQLLSKRMHALRNF